MDDFFSIMVDGWMTFFLHDILDWKDKLLSMTLDGLEDFFLNHHQWMDGWLSFSPSIWMDDFFLHHLGWMFSSAAVRSLFSLSLAASAVVWFVYGRSLQRFYILQRL
jgi:hypothetical protein